METLISNLASSKTRRAKLHGREHIVAPLTLIVPGVLNGSKGPLLYTPSEISKDYSAWNGVPIVINHPVVNGDNVSARDPDVSDAYQVGTVFKSRINNRGKLQAEGWFDVERLRQVDLRVLVNLEAGKPIELSTGLFTDNEPAASGAVYNGKPYSYVACNYKPDHLAILPDQVGACSLRDGCGVLVNKKHKGNSSMETNAFCATGTGGGIDSHCSSSGKGNSSKGISPKKKSTSLLKHSGLNGSVDSKGTIRISGGSNTIEKMKSSGWSQVSQKTESTNLRGISKVIKTKVNHKDFGSAEVRQHVGDKESGSHVSQTYITLNAQVQGVSAMTEQEKKQLVDNLIADVCCWKENDRPTLNALSDETLKGLVQAGQKAKEAEAVVNAVKQGFSFGSEVTVNAMPAALQAAIDAKKKKAGKATCDGDMEDEEPTKNKKPCGNAEQVKPVTTSEWLAQAPAEVQTVVRNAMRMEQGEKAKLIAVITANENNTFSKEQLDSLTSEQLAPIARLAAKSVQAPANVPSFMGASVPLTGNASQDDPNDVLPLPTLNFEAA